MDVTMGDAPALNMSYVTFCFEPAQTNTSHINKCTDGVEGQYDVEEAT